ncbi:hypothetical protein BHU72_03180 [Desulfuribacillus stibiiarsenatis]|uniref:Fluoride-specific ion channel FluC n=1 Tax=Desulfuribacillus stibiiarsenatis TaxID=1390249 RepID=A0A1E5L6X1_9FIRM|nr:CrcB family protein [Desulfuribacillus stibiiarsenatis]OEH85798.1 hypothetical protein BHU72_03180 [Desulfuribacillus stibiiarsenatis]
MKSSIFILIGGAIGASCRYLMNHALSFTEFPIWTISENLIGSLLLGILTGYVLIKSIPLHWQRGLGVGVCGGFTTMSTFVLDVVHLFQQQTLFLIMIYLFTSLFGGLIFAFIGMALGKRMASQQPKGATNYV